MMLLLEVMVASGQLIVGYIYLSAGLAKVKDIEGTQIAILDYRVIPGQLATPLAWILGLTEVIVGVTLMLGYALAAPAGLLLLSVLMMAATSALIRGLDINCHCLTTDEKLSKMTLVRNMSIASILFASILLEPPSLRSLFVPHLFAASLPHLLAVGIVTLTTLMIATSIGHLTGTVAKKVRES